MNNIVEGITCFGAHMKHNVHCQRTQCKHWLNCEDNHNCIMIAAQNGPHTLQTIGKWFSLTRMRICQIEKNVFSKIKKET